VNIEKLHGFLSDGPQSVRTLAARGCELSARSLPGEDLRRLGFFASCAVFGFEMSDKPWKLLVRFWFRRADRYLASTQEWCKRQGENLADWCAR